MSNHVDVLECEKAGEYHVRRGHHGHAAAIERDGYTVLILAAGAERNEKEIDRIVEYLNGSGGSCPDSGT